MASSSEFRKSQKVEDIEDQLLALEKLLDRTKAMFEQYFMGIQKVAPMQLHRDIERRVREMTQLQIRNTGLRFRFTTICQKFGAYNSYWKRTMREIDQGRYMRDLVRVKRKVEREGGEMPEELLVNLPKRIQDRIRRDRERLVGQVDRKGSGAEAPDGAAAESVTTAAAAAEAAAPPAPRERPGFHRISEKDAMFNVDDLDMDGLFGAMTTEVGPVPPPRPAPASSPASTTPPPARASTVPPPRPTGSGTLRQSPPVPRPPPPAAAAAAPRPRPASIEPPPGMSEKQCRELHARYVKARQMVGHKEDVAYDKLVQSLHKQAPAIMKEHGARGVEFNVIVRGDKVVLKAKPVK